MIRSAEGAAGLARLTAERRSGARPAAPRRPALTISRGCDTIEIVVDQFGRYLEDLVGILRADQSKPGQAVGAEPLHGSQHSA